MRASASKAKLCLLSVAIAMAATLAALPSLAGAAKPTIEPPEVRSSAQVITRDGQLKVLVKSLTIVHAHEVDVRATCRHCLRLPSPKPRELEPTRGTTRFVGLNWVLDDGLHIRVYVTAAGAVGSYVVLGPAKPFSRHRLVVEESGCLDRGEPASCGTENPPPSSTSSPNPHSTTVTYRETVGGNAETWTDYQNAGGLGGPLIAAGQTVEISCAVRGFAVANGNTWWYRIASSPWNDAYYASADAFYNNGQTFGSLVNTPYVDPAVPTCGN